MRVLFYSDKFRNYIYHRNASTNTCCNESKLGFYYTHIYTYIVCS